MAVGSTFTVLVTLQSSVRSAHKEHGIILPEGLRAIVVDDDEIACEHTQLVLRAIGIDSDIVNDGKSALELIRTAHEEGEPYHLLMADYKMPEMDGLELTRRVHDFDRSETAVIMLTGYNRDAIEAEAKMDGVDGLSATRTIRGMERPDAKTIPIIAMTANVFDEDVERSLQAGMNAHLSKPIEPERLYETMSKLIREKE